MRDYKVVVLGSGGVGKSALTVMFVAGRFIERYDPTIEDFYRKEIQIDGVPSMLEILDTAGTEQFASMRDLYIRNGHGFVVVYSVAAEQTLQDVKTMKDQILRIKGRRQVPVVLVGNKSDLVGQRRVPLTDGAGLAQTWGCPFLEASAKTAQNVNEVFIEIVREINAMMAQRDDAFFDALQRFALVLAAAVLTSTVFSEVLVTSLLLSFSSLRSWECVLETAFLSVCP